MNTFGFSERLDWSEGHAPSLEHVSRILIDRFPGCTHITKASVDIDRNGTDWLAHRRSVAALGIDLKLRKKDYGNDDLALETWSVIDIAEPYPWSPRVVGKHVGWTRDPQKNTDYVLWYWRDTRRFVLIPFPPLCSVFQRLWQEWTLEYRCEPQHSRENGREWFSQCVFVPRARVIESINRWMDPMGRR